MSMSTQKERKLMDKVRDVMRLHHYSIHTERTYCDWIKRYVLFHKMKSREDLTDGEHKIELFLLEKQINSIRASKKLNVPVVMTREETAKVMSLIEGTPQLVVKLILGMQFE